MLGNHSHMNPLSQTYSYTPCSTSFVPESQQYASSLNPPLSYTTTLTDLTSSSLPHTSVSLNATNDTTTLNSTTRSRIHLRKAAGKIWNDPSLDEWNPDDFRIFCGDLGNEVTDELLANAFRHYKSFQAARVIRDKRTGKGRGYGFVSFNDPHDMLRALKEMDRKYVGNRPIRVTKSQWKGREISNACSKKNQTFNILAPNNSKVFKKFKFLKKDITATNSVITGPKKNSGSTTQNYSEETFEKKKKPKCF